MEELLIRFLIGGVAVSAFSVLGDLLKPRTFAGIFGAAPSISIATLALAVKKDGPSFSAIEGPSMIAGAVAMLLYALVLHWFIGKHRTSVMWTSLAALPVWFGSAFALWWGVFR